MTHIQPSAFSLQHSAVTFVIMAGGKGERLWPLVREGKPKVCLAPDGDRTLLQRTIDRLRPIYPTADWLIVTTQGQAEAIRASLPARMRRAVLVEPAIKNTAACVGLAATWVAKRHPEGIMVVVPADHWIDQEDNFRATLRTAIDAAATHATLVTIGIRPTHAHPGLGYLCAGTSVRATGHARTFRLARFVEKPPAEAARALLKRGRTYWNSGMFIGPARTFLKSLAIHLPKHARHLALLADATSTSFARQAQRAYQPLEAISFDHGVMNHWQGGLIVEGNFGWADLGSWDIWARLGQASSRTVMVESQNVTVVGHNGHLVATVGVRDLVIVQTPSVTLVCHPDRAQAVREIVKRIATEPALASYR